MDNWFKSLNVQPPFQKKKWDDALNVNKTEYDDLKIS